MKKIVSLLLALLMVSAMLPVMAEDADVAGVWYLISMEEGGESFSPGMFGISITMTLNEDGTGALATAYGEEEESEDLTWELKDGGLTIVEEGIEMTLTLEDGQLKYAEQGMTFSREAPEDAALTAPAAVAAESEDAFIGEWALTYISAEGMLIPASMGGMEATLTVEAGKITLTSTMGDSEAETALKDGKLEANDGSVKIELNDNGWLSVPYEVEGELITVMYFEKAE